MYREEMHYKDIYYEEAEKQNKEVQKLKHDMKHKLHELYHLVENSDGQELSEKIGAMCMEFEQIDEKQYSDNPIVDSVLRIKFGRAKARGIKVETSIRIPKQMQLDHGDIGVLYGNLVDNAVEACSKVPEGQRFVKIENKYQSGILLLVITNSKTGKKNKSLKTETSRHRSAITLPRAGIPLKIPYITVSLPSAVPETRQPWMPASSRRPRTWPLAHGS